MAGLAMITIMVTSCYYDNEEYLYPELPGGECDTSWVSYSALFLLFMATNCNGCHSPASPTGGVVTSTYDGS